MHRNVLTQLSAVTKARRPEQPDVRGCRRARAATSARRLVTTRRRPIDTPCLM